MAIGETTLKDVVELLVEQHFAFARELADRFAATDRGGVVTVGGAGDMDDAEIRRHLTV